MYIKWSLEKLLMSLRCHVKLRWWEYFFLLFYFEE
jgi:hypothetical protein